MSAAPAVAAQAAAFPWLQVGLTILGSGAVAALVSAVIRWIDAHHDRKRVARDTALRAAAMFEVFAAAAADSASSAWHYDPHSEYARPLSPIPPSPEIDGLDWTMVQAGLAARALGFAQVVSLARAYVNATLEDDAADGMHEKYEQSLRLGLMAWSIASDLRRGYGLPQSDSSVGGYDFVAWMTAEVEVESARKSAARDRLTEVAARTGTERDL